MARVCAIVAMNDERVIGFQGKLPWHLPQDLKRFAQLTTGQVVLMGRKTYDSLPEKYRPLPERENVVVTRSGPKLKLPPQVQVASSPRGFIESFSDPNRTLWIIGGADIFKQTMDLWQELYLTVIHEKHEGDTYLPPFEHYFREVERESLPGYSFLRYLRNG